MFKLFLINLLLFCVFSVINILIVTYNIEKHSVHPKYGVFPAKAAACGPWDSC